MFKTWTGFGEEPDALARSLEAHLNEYAEELISVSYAIARLHYVLAVYKPIEGSQISEHAAVSAADQIINEAS